MTQDRIITSEIPKPRDAWDTLSMKEKAEMIGVAVRNGITSLKDIRQKYNEFAEGGSVDTDWSYNNWKKKIAEHMGIRPDEDNTYDYEAYFKKYPEEAWKMLKGDPTAHFSDEFKTVYHPTFSSKSIGNDGSIYSGVRNSKTNPQGLVGGTWSPDYHTFTMSPDGYRGPVSMDDRKWYLENSEDNGVQLREADGSLPIYDGIPWGGVLPNVNIVSSRRIRKFEDGGFTSELDWSPDSWFSKRVAKPDGTLYNDEEAARLASHVPEYNEIEQTAKENGTWLKMPDGSTWKGDPRSWVMMQSEAYKKNYSPKPWYTGQAEWPTTFDYGKGKVDTNKVTRAPYYNNQMWFSDSKDYGQTFADYQNSTGLGWRFDTPGEEDIKGHNFLSAIPKEGNYRTLESSADGRPDQWQRLPFVLEDGTINRLPESQISVDSKGRNIRADKQKVLTDDVVNWSKDLGDQGIFMQNIDDGAIIKNGEILRQPINEFISQPGFTDKVKFIEGNTGDFDIDNPYKYANNFYIKDNSLDNNYAALGGPLVEAAMNEYKKGGSIHIAPSKRGTFTAAAKKHGKSVQAFASQVLAHPENYSPAMRKKANFARNSRRWKHGLGGNLFLIGGPTQDDYPEGYWENRREHAEIRPSYKRTQKDEEYWKAKQKSTDRAAEELNRKKGIIMSALEEQAGSVPFTGESYKQATDDQRQKVLDKANDLKKGLKATITAAELGLSGASLLGAYANWRNWATAANLTKRGIANLLQKAQAPMQEAGALIDGYQTMDAYENNDFDTYYNGASGILGVAGTVGASDIFRGRYPMVDRVLDTSGIIQNAGDFIKFGYDTLSNKAE